MRFRIVDVERIRIAGNTHDESFDQGFYKYSIQSKGVNFMTGSKIILLARCELVRKTETNARAIDRRAIRSRMYA